VRRERGAVLVETALLLPLILMLVFGVIEFSFAFQSSAVLNDATRRSARTAASLAGDANLQQAVLDVAEEQLDKLPETATPIALMIYKANVHGYPGTDGNTTLNMGHLLLCEFQAFGVDDCVVWFWDPGAREFDESVGSWAPSNQTACVQPYERVGVAIYVKYHPLTSIFDPFLEREAHATQGDYGGDPRLDHVAFVFEPEPLGAC